MSAKEKKVSRIGLQPRKKIVSVAHSNSVPLDYTAFYAIILGTNQ